MNEVAIVTDSVACILPEHLGKYKITQVPMLILFEDSVYRDGMDMSPTEFYVRLRQAKKLPTTSHPSPEAFLEAYRDAGQTAANILCITIPAKFSATFNSAKLAVEVAGEALPGAVIEVLDCGTAAAAQGFVVLAAARAAADGKSLTEVVEIARSVMRRVHLLATLDTLRYLAKGGRVPKAAALASSLLQIKPIFTVIEGEAHPVTNARTTSGAMKRILKIIMAVRGETVIMDSDLAKLYGVETRRLNEQVRRNIEKFPEDFVFQLTKEEFENLKSQIATSSFG